jgi:hypothetical protein
MTSAKTHDDLTRLLTRYDHWAGDRQELFAIESETGHFPHPDAAFHSDDDGVELLHEIVSVIRALVPASLFNPLVASIVELHDGDTAILDVRVVALDQAWIIAGRPPGLPEVRPHPRRDAAARRYERVRLDARQRPRHAVPQEPVT